MSCLASLARAATAATLACSACWAGLASGGCQPFGATAPSMPEAYRQQNTSAGTVTKVHALSLSLDRLAR